MVGKLKFEGSAYERRDGQVASALSNKFPAPLRLTTRNALWMLTCGKDQRQPPSTQYSIRHSSA